MSVNAKVLKLLPHIIPCRNYPNTSLGELAKLSFFLDIMIYVLRKINVVQLDLDPFDGSQWSVHSL